MNIYFGIDFGTTNTVISMAGKTDKIIDSISIPTILYIPKDEGINRVFIGKEAVERYRTDKNGRYIHSIKRSLLDTHFKFTTINRVKVTLEDLICLFLNELKTRIYETWGIFPEKIALGKPVKFSEIEEENKLANIRLLDGFKLAEFKNIIQLEEPIAAAYGINTVSEIIDENVLIVDIGGGTTDFTSIKIDSDNTGISRFIVKNIDGIDVGGDNFDEDIMFRNLTPFFGLNETYMSYNRTLELPIHIFTDICKWNLIYRFDRVRLKEEIKDYLYKSSNTKAIRRLEKIYLDRLSSVILDEVKEAKHILTDNDKTEINLNKHELDVCSVVDKSTLFGIFEKNLNKIITVHKKMNDESDIPFDKIFVTGGSSKLPQIRKIIEDLNKNITIEFDTNYFSSISNGLALYCKYKYEDIIITNSKNVV